MKWVGLAARSWDLLGGDEPGPDYSFFLEPLRQLPGPALDLACGTGRLLLRYRAQGLDVDGVDSSADMLHICREKAAAQDIPVQLFHQPMQKLDLPRRYGVLFSAGGSFALIPARSEVAAALDAFHRHLLPGGLLAFSLFSPFAPGKALAERLDEGWVVLRERVLEDGSQLVHDFRREVVDADQQVLTERKRYRVLWRGTTLAEEAYLMHERWYLPDQLTRLLGAHGFESVRVCGDFGPEEWRPEHRVMGVTAVRS